MFSRRATPRIIDLALPPDASTRTPGITTQTQRRTPGITTQTPGITTQTPGITTQTPGITTQTQTQTPGITQTQPPAKPPRKTTCHLKTNSETYIYHFDINRKEEVIKTTCWNKVVYVYLSIKPENTITIIEKIFKKCQPHNILIYITHDQYHQYHSLTSSLYRIRRMVRENTKDLLNVTIINKVIDKSYLLVQDKNKGKFKKVINILPYVTEEDKKYYDDYNYKNDEINKSYMKYVDQTNYYTHTMKSTHVTDSTYNPNDLPDTTLDDNGLPNSKPTCNPEPQSEIVNEWWFKYYFDVPSCAYGRLLQSTGTCWMNAILNTIILTPRLVKIATNNFYDDTKLHPDVRTYIKTNIDSFSKLNNKTFQLRTLLFGMIYLLFIKKVKAQEADGNFVAAIGARVKGLYYHKDQFKWENNDMIKYGNSGHAGLKNIVLSILFKENIDYIFNKNILYYNNQPIIIYDYNPKRSITESIKIRDNKYNLEAGIIGLYSPNNNKGHSVAGLKCDDKYYIYDSNNYIVYNEWYRDHAKTIDYINKYYNNYYNYNYKGIYYTIYVKEEDTKRNFTQRGGRRKRRKTVKTNHQPNHKQ